MTDDEAARPPDDSREDEAASPPDDSRLDEAAWHDLVGRIEAAPEHAGAAAPWPASENLAPRPPPGVLWVTAPGQPRTSAPADDEEDDDEHFVPPPPPPLPSLTPVAKGAWAGLFGGPGYLLTATVAGWAVPGWAAFCAVAAFVAGFMLLVLRIGGEPPQDPGSGDGAVV